MKRFQFRLQRLQKLRERMRETKKIALAEAVQYRARVEGQIDHLVEVKQEEQEQLRAQLTRPELVVEEAIRARTYDTLLGRYKTRLDAQLQQVETVVVQRRVDLMEAEKGVRILEKLEERERRRYDHLVAGVERELMDELAQLADQRRRLGGDESL